MKTVMYSTTITATFRIEVEAESIDEAERIVDGVLDSEPAIVIMEVDPSDPDPKFPASALDALYSAPLPGHPSVVVRGTMHRRRTLR